MSAPWITVWPTLKTTTGRAVQRDWPELFERFSRRVEFRHDLHPGWSPAVFEDGKREKARVQRVFAMVLDIDGTWNIDAAAAAFDGLFGFIHTSKRHSEDAHRFRIILPTSRPMGAYEYAGVWRRMAAQWPGKLDPQAKDPSRFWYTPGVVADGPFETRWLEGERLDVDAVLEQPEPVQQAPSSGSRSDADVHERARKYLERMPSAISGQGGHVATLRAAIALARGFDLSETETLDLLRSEYNPRCDPPWSEKELRHKANHARHRSRAPFRYIIDRDERRADAGPGDDGSVPDEWLGEEDDSERMPGDDSDERERATWVERYGVQRLSDTIGDVWEACQRKEKPPAVTTTHHELDRAMGGYRRGFITVLGATTNWGKSSFAIAAADEGLRFGKRILVITCEDTPVMYGKRIAARRSGINALVLRDETLDEQDLGKLLNTRIRAEETPWILNGIGKSAEYLAGAISRLCGEHDYDLVIVDYLQRIRAKAQDRRNEVTAACNLIADAIKRGNAAGLLLSQIKRLETGKQPTRHDLKESGDIENMAEHILIGRLRKDVDVRTGRTSEQRFIVLDKNKDGPSFADPIWLQFDEFTASFRNVGGATCR